MLASYRTNTQSLLQNPGAPVTLYATGDIDRWVNIARGQLAGESEAIQVHGTIATVIGQRAYNFSSLNLGTPSVTGVQGAIHISRINIDVASGQRWLTPRPWEWFSQYHLNNPVPVNGIPTTWAQYGQGSAGTGTGSSATGTFWLDPPPDDVYTLTCNSVCYPIALVDDATVEAIPYLWTDAVPFFASYYALLSSQTSARQADAERMFGHYQTFVERARVASNPSVLRWQYKQASDPTQASKLGLKPAVGAGQ